MDKQKTKTREWEEEIKIKGEIAGIAGVLQGSAVGDSGQSMVAQIKAGNILELLPKLIKKVEDTTKKDMIEKIEWILGGWVSNEYLSEHYEDECISPKMFWKEWVDLKDDLLSSLNSKEE